MGSEHTASPVVGIDEVRAGVVAEADWQFSGRLAPELASPLYEALARHVAATDALLQLVAGARQPNIRVLLAAVHSLLLTGVDHPLRHWFPTVGGDRSADDDLAGAFDGFVGDHRSAIEALLATRGVQTNEVRRSAVILPAIAHAAAVAGGPIALVELGASAGLNLLVDRYRIRYATADGRGGGDDVIEVGPEGSPVAIDCELRGGSSVSLFPAPSLPIVARVGVDLEPIDVNDHNAVAWLRACVWADHPERLAQLDAAISVARHDPPDLVAGDMVDALPSVLAEIPDDVTPVVFHTNAVNYLDVEQRAALVERLRAASDDRRVLWLSGEAPNVLPDLPSPPDAMARFAVPMVLTELGDGAATSTLLALAGVHGGWLDWGAGS